jgi:hypothetical protein
MENYKLTKIQARFIKKLRKQDYTWRSVAREFTEKYPYIESPTSNQIVGLILCRSAGIKLEEDDEIW